MEGDELELSRDVYRPAATPSRIIFFSPRKIVGIVWAWRMREKREEKLQEEEEEGKAANKRSYRPGVAFRRGRYIQRREREEIRRSIHRPDRLPPRKRRAFSLIAVESDRPIRVRAAGRESECFKALVLLEERPEHRHHCYRSDCTQNARF